MNSTNVFVALPVVLPPQPAAITGVYPPAGDPGQKVTIYGINFANASAVTFNGVAATDMQVLSSLRILATVPATASGKVSITTPVNKATSKDDFSIYSDKGGIPRLDVTTPDINAIGRDAKVVVDFAMSNDLGSTYAPSQLYVGKGTLKVRGNTTAGLPKKPYSMTLTAANGTSSLKMPLLGLGTNSKFTLLACFQDPTLLVDMTCLKFAELTGQIGVRTRPIRLYVNNAYHGYYLLTEKVAEQNFIGFPKSGYLYEKALAFQQTEAIDFFTTRLFGGLPWTGPVFQNIAHIITIAYPEYGDAGPERKVEAEALLQAAEKSLQYPWMDLENGPQKFFDAEALVLYFFAQEWCKNGDAESASSFLHTAPDGKMHLGPVWDFGAALNNTDDRFYVPSGPVGDWVRQTPWFSALFADTDFAAYASEVFASKIVPVLPVIAQFYRDKATMLRTTGVGEENNQKWRTYLTTDGTPVNYLPSGIGSFYFYRGVATMVEKFIAARTRWLLQRYRPTPIVQGPPAEYTGIVAPGYAPADDPRVMARVPETAWTYTGNWLSDSAGEEYYEGGAAKYTLTDGDSASLTYYGGDFLLSAICQSNESFVDVTVDGQYYSTFVAYSNGNPGKYPQGYVLMPEGLHTIVLTCRSSGTELYTLNNTPVAAITEYILDTTVLLPPV